MSRKWLFLCGILAAIVYVAVVIVGGALRPGYDHLVEPVSELTAAGAPNKDLLDIGFLVYNLLVVLFGVGVFLQAASPTRRMSGVVAGLALVVTGICGVLLQLFFPQDPGGAQAAVTTTGTMHIVFAGLAALASMVAALSAAVWFRRQPEWKGYTVYSLVTLAVMFVSGGIGAAGATSGFSLFGLVERITIGSLILWLFVVGLKFYRSAASEPIAVPTSKPHRRLNR